MNKKDKDTSITKLFVGAQLAALIATVVDFSVLAFCKEVLGLWYVTATAIGAFVGACTNFLLGRYWVFTATESKMEQQAFRYIIVSVGSLLLKYGRRVCGNGIWRNTLFLFENYSSRFGGCIL